QLACDSVSASKSKCGFSPFTGPSTKLYLTQTATMSGSLYQSFTDPGDPHCFYTLDNAIDALRTETYDPDTCTSSCSVSGSFSGNFTGDGMDCYPGGTTTCNVVVTGC